MMRLDNMAYQFIEWSRLPVPVCSTERSGLVDFSQNLVGREPLGTTSVFERLLSAAAVVKAVLFQNSNRVERSCGQVGQGHGGCHKHFLSFWLDFGPRTNREQ